MKFILHLRLKNKENELKKCTKDKSKNKGFRYRKKKHMIIVKKQYETLKYYVEKLKRKSL